MPGLGTGRLPSNSVLQGRYIIVKKVGQGGMGATYQATDQRIAGRLWAIKEMSMSWLTDPADRAQAIQAFQQEAGMLARLDHPNLPKVADFFQEGGQYYLVMDFVEGETLEGILGRQGRRPLPETQVLELAKQLCDVLDYLHSQTPPVVFRDLKPSNIMITPDGRVKLIDFGIARHFKPGKATDTAALGTPGYAPLEQYGRGQTDARSDIYSLGMTLHELLTGHDPTSTPFNLPAARQLNPAVSPYVEAAIQKATQARPDDRFQTVAEMRQALAGTTAVQALQWICTTCGAANRATARFCSYCGAVAPAIPSPVVPSPPSPITPTTPPSPAVPFLPDLWTVQLSADLHEVKSRLFHESREGLVNKIVGAVLKEDIGTTGVTIMLRGIEGFGGTAIATQVKDDILRSRRRTVTLVAAVDLSDPVSLAEPARTLEEILMALRRGSGAIGRKLRNTVRKTYRRQMTVKRPVAREMETRRRTSLTPFPVSLEVVTPWGRASLDSPFTHESQVSEKEVSKPLNAEQLVTDLLDTLRDLVDYLVLERVRVILIFDKVKDIGVLTPLVPIVSRGGVYSIVVANIDDHSLWRSQNSELLKRFSKKDFYVPCAWDLPNQLCTRLTSGGSEPDSQEFYFFQKFLEYHGRGVPDRTIKAIERFYSPPKRVPGIPNWLKRLLLMEVEYPAEIAISRTQWQEIIRCADLQRRLEAGWSEIFGGLQSGTLPLGVLTEETADQARSAIYSLTDWLLHQAEKGVKVSKREVTDYALARCKMPFDERVSKQVVAQFITFLVRENKVAPTSRELDLSGLLVTPLLGDYLLGN